MSPTLFLKKRGDKYFSGMWRNRHTFLVRGILSESHTLSCDKQTLMIVLCMA